MSQAESWIQGPVGSSEGSNSGWLIRARMTATRWHSPTDISPRKQICIVSQTDWVESGSKLFPVQTST